MAKIFDLNIYNGSYIDLITNDKMDINGSPQLKRDRGWSYYNNGSSSYLDKDTEFNVTGGTIAYAFKLNSQQTGNVGCVAITDDSGVRFESYHAGGITNYGIRLFADGKVYYTEDYKNDNKWHFVIAIFDGTNYKAYIDGVEEELFYFTTVGTQTANKITIGKLTSAASTLNGYMNFVQIYDHVLSEDERNELYSTWLYQNQIIAPPVRGFINNALQIENEPSLIVGYDFGSIYNTNKLKDITGNNDLTQVGKIMKVKDGVRSSAIGNYLTAGDTGENAYSFEIILNSDISISKETSDFKTPITFQSGYEYNGVNLGKWTSFVSNEVISLGLLDGGNQYRTCWVSTSTIMSKTDLHLFFNWNSTESRYDMWVNGDKKTVVSGTSAGHVPLYDIDELRLFTGSEAETSRDFLGVIKKVRIWNESKTDEYILNEYNNFANQVYIYENFRKNGADEQTINIPRGWTYNSGTYKIRENVETGTTLNIGDKYLLCLTDGNIGLQSSQAYGTWEFDYQKGLDVNESRISLISNLNTVGNDPLQEGYYIHFRGDEILRLTKANLNSFTDLISTSSSYFENDIWYRIKVTRTIDSEFKLYIKGGSFGDTYTLVGSATDSTFTTSNYFNIDLDSTDRIANIKMFKGVEK